MKTRRYTFFFIILAAVFVVFAAKLINLQLAKGAYYREKSDSRTTRSVELVAPRGQIFDRYGRPIVQNRTGYNLYIQQNEDKDSEVTNKVIYNLINIMPDHAAELTETMPIVYENEKYKFNGDTESFLNWKKDNGFERKLSAKKVAEQLFKRYFSEEESYSYQMMLKIVSVRLDMSVRGFSLSTPYLFREDTPLEVIQIIKEQSEKFPDVCIVAQPMRDYPYVSLAAHTLGRVGLVSPSEYKEYKDYGYTINSSIGKNGVEKLLEDYLRGENGVGSIERTDSGYSISQSMQKAPKAGRDVTLTLDLDLQLACEKALKDTIDEIRATSSSGDDGGASDSGSAVVIDVNTGEILAMASYPSYDINNFSKNYSELVKDPSKPLFNRALAGTYSPASTFKILVGASALEDGLITPDEEIFDTGKYKYYKDYQPSCWIYGQTGATHGYVNVSEAIRDSCNVFFYDVGRRLGIDKIVSYAEKFGFGNKSGIELADEEKSGIIASPENRKKNSGIWYPGDVMQTAIGQSDTLATPIQLANYIATVANGGTRYRPHIIKSVQKDNSKETSQTHTEVLEYVKLKQETHEAISKGIRMVVTEGTGYSAFAGCKTPVAAKTGSAQTSGNYTNGICVAFAPYDKPRIAIACVIEKSGSGAKTAGAIRKIVDAYFNADNSKVAEQFNSLSR